MGRDVCVQSSGLTGIALMIGPCDGTALEVVAKFSQG